MIILIIWVERVRRLLGCKRSKIIYFIQLICSVELFFVPSPHRRRSTTDAVIHWHRWENRLVGGKFHIQLIQREALAVTQNEILGSMFNSCLYRVSFYFGISRPRLSRVVNKFIRAIIVASHRNHRNLTSIGKILLKCTLNFKIVIFDNIAQQRVFNTPTKNVATRKCSCFVDLLRCGKIVYAVIWRNVNRRGFLYYGILILFVTPNSNIGIKVFLHGIISHHKHITRTVGSSDYHIGIRCCIRYRRIECSVRNGCISITSDTAVAHHIQIWVENERCHHTFSPFEFLCPRNRPRFFIFAESSIASFCGSFHANGERFTIERSRCVPINFEPGNFVVVVVNLIGLRYKHF